MFRFFVCAVLLLLPAQAVAQFSPDAALTMVAASKDDSDAIEALQEALRARFAAEGVSGLMPYLTRGTPRERQISADILGEKFRRARFMGEQPKGLSQAIVVLVQLAETADVETRRHAIEALGFSGNSSRLVVDALTRLLSSKKAEIAYRAARAIGGIGPAARSATPALIRTLGRKSWIEGFVRAGAAKALGKIGDTQAIRPLTTIVAKDSYWKAKQEAARALGTFGPHAKGAVPALISALTYRRHWRVRYHAAQALGKIGEPSAVPALVKAYKKETLRVDVCDLPTRGCRKISVNRAARKALERLNTPQSRRALGKPARGGKSRGGSTVTPYYKVGSNARRAS